MLSFRCLSLICKCSKDSNNESLQPHPRTTTVASQPKKTQSNVEFPLSTYIDETHLTPRTQEKDHVTTKTQEDDHAIHSQASSSSNHLSQLVDQEEPQTLYPMYEDQNFKEEAPLLDGLLEEDLLDSEPKDLSKDIIEEDLIIDNDSPLLLPLDDQDLDINPDHVFSLLSNTSEQQNQNHRFSQTTESAQHNLEEDSDIDEESIDYKLKEQYDADKQDLSLPGLMTIVQTANSIGGIRKIRQQFKQKRRILPEGDIQQYLASFVKYNEKMERQFETNLQYVLQKFGIERHAYEQALLHNQSDISDSDLEVGLFNRHVPPSTLTHAQAQHIEAEVEDYILKEWEKTSADLQKYSLPTEQLLKLLRCMSEDNIHRKYDIEVEQVYKFLSQHQADTSMEHEDNTNNSRSSTKRRSKILNAKIAARMSIFTVEEEDDCDSSMSSL